MPVTVRPLRESEWLPLVEALSQSFNAPVPGWERFRERLGDEQLRVAYDERERVIGGYAIYPMGQVWHGRSVPLGGIAGVGVLPDARGDGVAKEMMVDALAELHRRRIPVAGLYPATQRVYRSVGYEQAGERVRYEVPLSSLGGFRFEVEVTPVDPVDPQAVAVFRERYRPAHGNLDRSDAIWSRLSQPYVGRRFAWLLGEDGYAILQHAPIEGVPFDLELYDYAAPSAATARTLLALLAGHRSMAKKLRWQGAPTDPLLALVPEPTWSVLDLQRWMLRLVDVPAALRARGWAPGVAGELHLRVVDELLAHNVGDLVLTVADGEALVRPGGRGELRVGPRALGPLYSGYFTASQLRALGHLDGLDAAIATADRLFASPTPWMREMY